MKYAGSSVEGALSSYLGEAGLCTGGMHNEDFKARNNKTWVDGKSWIRFNPHTWPKLFFHRCAAPEEWKDFKKITIVRNPWDAVVSYYWWCVVQDDNTSLCIDASDDRQDAQLKFETAMGVASMYTGDPLAMEMDIESVITTPLAFIGHVNRRFVSDEIDCYLRYESLQEDYTILCDELDVIPLTLPRYKSTHRKLKYHYSYYYNARMRRRVTEEFAELIEKFGYEFDAP